MVVLWLSFVGLGLALTPRVRLHLSPLKSRVYFPLCSVMLRLPYDAGVEASSALLGKFDADHRAGGATDGARRFGDAINTNETARVADRTSLAEAVKILSGAAISHQGLDQASVGRVMLGICAQDAIEGVNTLKAWVTCLDLPKGPIHGMDIDGVPIDMSNFGAVYIKYNSLSSAQDPQGSAQLSGYKGDVRGVYFSPMLPDGIFRQYAVLPLDLFASDSPVKFSAVVDSASKLASTVLSEVVQGGRMLPRDRSSDSVSHQQAAAVKLGQLQPDDIRGILLELSLLVEIALLGIAVEVVATTVDGVVSLSYSGPPKMRKAVEMQVRSALRAADNRVRRVEFVADSRQ